MSELPNAVFAAVMVLLGPRIDLPPAEVQKQFEQLCVEGRWHSDCPVLRMDLEVQLYYELHELYMAGAPLDPETLRVAANASFPYLANFALRRIGTPQSPEDRDAVMAAIDHPVPSVRIQAKHVADRMGDSWREGIGRWWAIPNATMAPQNQPDMQALGLAVLDDQRFRYHFMASQSGRAMYTTTLTPDQVLDLIAKGKPVVTGDKLGGAPGQTAGQQAMADKQKEFAAIAKQMQEAAARGDYKTMQELGKQMQAAQGGFQQQAKQMQDMAGMQPITAFSVEPSQVRYVRLADTRDGKRSRGGVIAAVGRDDAWGETVVVVTFSQ